MALCNRRSSAACFCGRSSNIGTSFVWAAEFPRPLAAAPGKTGQTTVRLTATLIGGERSRLVEPPLRGAGELAQGGAGGGGVGREGRYPDWTREARAFAPTPHPLGVWSGPRPEGPVARGPSGRAGLAF